MWACLLYPYLLVDALTCWCLPSKQYHSGYILIPLIETGDIPELMRIWTSQQTLCGYTATPISYILLSPAIPSSKGSRGWVVRKGWRS